MKINPQNYNVHLCYLIWNYGIDSCAFHHQTFKPYLLATGNGNSTWLYIVFIYINVKIVIFYRVCKLLGDSGLGIDAAKDIFRSIRFNNNVGVASINKNI